MAVFNIRDFGAIGNGTQNDTECIQAAIDTCARSGGGTVFVPRGNYLCGALFLKSYVHLHLDPGARIVSSMEEKDFPMLQNGKKAALICARDGKQIAITGMGVIDGQGERFLEPDDGKGKEHVLRPIKTFRPKLIDLEGCTDVMFRDVTLYRPSAWCLHMTGCSRVLIDGIKILGQLRGPNNDGIDPDSCRDVHICNCHIETGDDCIVLKTTRYGAEQYGACENITVSNCTLFTHDTALKIGTETYADIRNIVFQNCVVWNSNRGLGIWVRDGATVENVLFSNIVIDTRLYSDEEEPERPVRWWGKGEPIFISAERRNWNSPAPGKIQNIRFEHILTTSEGGIYLEGSEGSEIEGIALRNVKHIMRCKSGYPGGLFDTQPSLRGVFPHTIPAIFCRYAKDVSLHDITVEWRGERNRHWSNALYGEYLEQLSIKDFRGAPAFRDGNAIELKNVRGLRVEGSQAMNETGVFLKLEDVDPQDMFMFGNDFSKAASAVQFTDGTTPTYFAFANKMPRVKP